MDKKVAKSLMASFFAMSEPLNAASDLIDEIDDMAEQKTFREGVGRIMGSLYTDLMVPIIRQYPDLDPDRAN